MLSLLDGFQLRCDGQAVRIPLSAQRVLAFVALNPGGRMRLFVAGHLWADASEQRAAAALRTALWRLGPMGSRFVGCDGQRLKVRATVDVEGASRIARECLDPIAPLISPAAFASLRDTGDLLPDWYDDWVLIERECFRQLRLNALETLCVRLCDNAQYAQATEAGLAAVRSDPLRESAHRALVTAHLSGGNSGDGLRQYRLCRRLLRRDLGISPSDAMQRLVAHLLAPGERDTQVTDLE
jgi:DNA-binding SARP family transcriptional activator